MNTTPTIHASAVLVGPKAALIRGPAGCGKSSLVWQLLSDALPFARLVADDRAYVEARAGRLLVRPAQELAGLIEIRGLGVRRLPFEPVAVVGLIVDLGAADAARLPGRSSAETSVAGVNLPRLAAIQGHQALPLIVAFLKELAAAD